MQAHQSGNRNFGYSKASDSALLNTWDLGCVDQPKKKQLEEYFFQVSQLTIVTKERGGYWAHLISHSSCQQQALHLHYLKGKISTQKYL